LLGMSYSCHNLWPQSSQSMATIYGPNFKLLPSTLGTSFLLFLEPEGKAGPNGRLLGELNYGEGGIRHRHELPLYTFPVGAPSDPTPPPIADQWPRGNSSQPSELLLAAAWRKTDSDHGAIGPRQNAVTALGTAPGDLHPPSFEQQGEPLPVKPKWSAAPTARRGGDEAASDQG